jgi:hypothetical protein
MEGVHRWMGQNLNFFITFQIFWSSNYQKQLLFEFKQLADAALTEQHE